MHTTCNKDELCVLCSQCILFSFSEENVFLLKKKQKNCLVANRARQQLLGISVIVSSILYVTAVKTTIN